MTKRGCNIFEPLGAQPLLIGSCSTPGSLLSSLQFVCSSQGCCWQVILSWLLIYRCKVMQLLLSQGPSLSYRISQSSLQIIGTCINPGDFKGIIALNAKISSYASDCLTISRHTKAYLLQRQQKDSCSERVRLEWLSHQRVIQDDSGLDVPSFIVLSQILKRSSCW